MGSLGGWFQTDSHSRSGGSASELESGDQGAHRPNGVPSECSFYYHGKQRAWLRMFEFSLCIQCFLQISMIFK